MKKNIPKQKIKEAITLTQDYYKSASILFSEGQYRDTLPLLEIILAYATKTQQQLLSYKPKIKNKTTPDISALNKTAQQLKQALLNERPYFLKTKVGLLEELITNIGKSLDYAEWLYRKVFPLKLSDFPLLEKIWKKIVALSTNKTTHIIVGVLVLISIVFSVATAIHNYNLSKLTTKYYSAALGDTVFVSGWSDFYEKDKTRSTLGNNATIRITPINPSKNQIVIIPLYGVIVSPSSTNYNQQQIIAHVNGQLIEKYTINKAQVVAFHISHELITSKSYDLQLEIPQAFSPTALGMWEDPNKRALCIQGLYYTAEDDAPLYFMGKTIAATDDKYFTQGWCPSYQNTRWTINGYSEIRLKTQRITKDLSCELQIKQMIYQEKIAEKQRIRISINNKFVTETILNVSPQKLIFSIPQALLGNTQTITIGIYCPDSMSPESLGQWKDTNPMSFALQSFKITPK